MGRFYQGQAAGLMVNRIAILQTQPDLATTRWYLWPTQWRDDMVVAWRFICDGSMMFQLSSVIGLVLVFYCLSSAVRPPTPCASAATPRSEARPAPPAQRPTAPKR
jgi:hypothetical protein